MITTKMQVMAMLAAAQLNGHLVTPGDRIHYQPPEPACDPTFAANRLNKAEKKRLRKQEQRHKLAQRQTVGAE